MNLYLEMGQHCLHYSPGGVLTKANEDVLL